MVRELWNIELAIGKEVEQGVGAILVKTAKTYESKQEAITTWDKLMDILGVGEVQ